MSPAAERIRVLIADDHAVVRNGVRLLLEAQHDIDVVGEAADGPEAVRLACSAAPDVVLLDLSMPGPGGGTGGIATMRKRAPRARVLVLTMHDEDAYVRSALDSGAAGYVVKHVDGHALIAAIRSVHQGRIHVNVSRTQDTPAAAASVPLSRRERQVLTLLAQGHSNLAVAHMLELSVKTVETYRTRLGAKLGLRTRAELFRYAVERGVLSAGDLAATAKGGA